MPWLLPAVTLGQNQHQCSAVLASNLSESANPPIADKISGGNQKWTGFEGLLIDMLAMLCQPTSAQVLSLLTMLSSLSRNQMLDFRSSGARIRTVKPVAKLAQTIQHPIAAMFTMARFFCDWLVA